MLLGAWGGSLADRFAKRDLLMLTQAMMMAPPLIIREGDHTLALPQSCVESIVLLPLTQLIRVGSRLLYRQAEKTCTVALLRSLLEREPIASVALERLLTQLRRQALPAASADPVLRFGRVSVDLSRRVVERDGAPLHLTPIEYRLLTHLAAQPDRVVTHQQLLKAVWGPGHAEDTHYVRVHMANLRKKVEDDASMPRHLLTEAGIGYRFRP